jgi:A/G-specific adenine glycosylase
MSTPEVAAGFAPRLLAWWDRHGRKDLPWQRQRTPYRVWVAEIMLQQTQVAAVAGYFERFVAAFPDVAALAAAPLDAVLHRWSGLGYYARARNLHRAARLLAADGAAEPPATLEALCALPGIGRSTAGAILACAFGTRAPILDGNVRRVLARHRAVAGAPGERAASALLWALAEALTPHARVGDYTQAIMDLGATVCTRTRPRCDDCPVAADCIARASGRVAELPSVRRRAVLPVRAARMLVVRRPDGGVLLEQRPARGLWGGLWTFPELAADTAVDTALAHLGVAAGTAGVRELPPFEHAFTHFRLTVSPLLVELGAASPVDSGRTACGGEAGGADDGSQTVVAGDDADGGGPAGRPPVAAVTRSGAGAGTVAGADGAPHDRARRWYRPGHTRIGVARPVSRILTELPAMSSSEPRLVHCRRLGRLLPGLARPPFPGPRGEAIFAGVSQQAWDEWLALQTMLINEHRLSATDPQARRYLAEQCERFLDNQPTEKPAGFVPRKD